MCTLGSPAGEQTACIFVGPEKTPKNAPVIRNLNRPGRELTSPPSERRLAIRGFKSGCNSPLVCVAQRILKSLPPRSGASCGHSR